MRLKINIYHTPQGLAALSTEVNIKASSAELKALADIVQSPLGQQLAERLNEGGLRSLTDALIS